ncbi:hypothetical protein WEH80_38555 [Actinomycetes bacterium KLBMP 9759]
MTPRRRIRDAIVTNDPYWIFATRMFAQPCPAVVIAAATETSDASRSAEVVVTERNWERPIPAARWTSSARSASSWATRSTPISAVWRSVCASRSTRGVSVACASPVAVPSRPAAA